MQQHPLDGGGLEKEWVVEQGARQLAVRFVQQQLQVELQPLVLDRQVGAGQARDLQGGARRVEQGEHYLDERRAAEIAFRP